MISWVEILCTCLISSLLIISNTAPRYLSYIIIGLCGFETISGFLQNISICRSNSSLYSITGSFHNPGPYGGFLSICICLIEAQYIKIKYYSKSFKEYYRITLLVILIASVIVLPATQSRSAILGLVSGLILLVFRTDVIRVKLKMTVSKYWLLILLGLVIIALGLYMFKKPSADGRLFMDKICMDTMFRNGWKGVGIGMFGGAYGSTQHDYFKRQMDNNGMDDLDWTALNQHDRLTADCPENAFNEYLFVGVELGALAMLVLIAVLLSCIVISFKRGTIWCYGLTAFAVFAFFSYPLHLWQFQVLLPMLLSASISDRINRSKRLVILFLTIIPVIIAIYTINILPRIKQFNQAKEAWKQTERWYQMEYYEYVVEDCDTLLPYMKHDRHYLFAYGQSLNIIGNYLKSDSILSLGTKISSDPMFWNVMGNNSLAQGKYREAEERYKHAFYMVPNRLYPLYLLAKLYHTEGDTVKFLDMADKVETFIPKVESVNTERLRNEIRDLKSGYITEQYE